MYRQKAYKSQIPGKIEKQIKMLAEQYIM